MLTCTDMLNPKLKILDEISKFYNFTISYGIFQNGIQYSQWQVWFRMERCGTFKLSLM